MKKTVLLGVAGFLTLGILALSGVAAMMCGEEMQTTQAHDTTKTSQKKKAVNAGNKICPVSGENIDDKTKATYEYKGKIYNFCCAGCIAEFKKDPQGYIEKVDKELQAESKEGKGVEAGAGTAKAKAMPMSMPEGHQH